MADFEAANKANDEEEEVNSSERRNHEVPDAEKMQEPLSQTSNEESTGLSQTPLTSDQLVEIQAQEVASEEEGSGVSFQSDTIAVPRGSDISVQRHVDNRVHENQQRNETMHKTSIKQSSPSQQVEGLVQSSYSEGEMSGSRLKSDEMAVTPKADESKQVRIFHGRHEKHSSLEVTPAESGSISELNHILGSDVSCVPVTSLQDNISVEETTRPPESMLLVTGRRDGAQIFKTKFPVHDYSDCSVQVPSPGIQTTQFVLERKYPSVPRNETHISVHFLASQDFRQGELCVLLRRMEEQPGTRLVRFCVEHVDLQETPRYINTAFIAKQVTVRFQLVNQVERNFRLKDPPMAEKVITAPQIQSLTGGNVESPGAEAKMWIECVAEVGQLCQDYLRITLDYGDTSQNLLLSI